MTRQWITALVAFVAIAMLGAGLEGAQRGWTMGGKASGRSATGGALVAKPQASIGGGANGIYCTPASENGVGVHHLGGLPAGLGVTVTVESYTDQFNPVAAVIVATVGEKGGNNVKTATFYDNDSGGDNDSKIAFVTPQSGDYVLLVGDYTDAYAGCYRYEVTLR
jgi:hypothetical protein